MEIVTNNVPRHLIYGFELSDKERLEFDYLSDNEIFESVFFKYKGEIYDLNEFMRITDTMALHDNKLKEWHAYMAHSYFSGVLIRYDESMEEIVVGQFFS